VWVIARWFDSRGRPGPASNPLFVHVGAMIVTSSLAA
jgi:hypothetical protein